MRPTERRTDHLVFQAGLALGLAAAAALLAGRTLEDTALRKLTGASIIAIMRGGKALPNRLPRDRI